MGRPSLDLVLQSLANAGVKSACVVTHYLEEQIADYLETQTWLEHTSIAHQPTMDGTGNAVNIGWNECASLPPNTADTSGVLISATDYLLDEYFYSQLVDFHHSHEADMTISLKAVPEEELSLRSSVRIDNNNFISEVVEKPAPGTAPSAFSANLLYIVPPGFDRYLKNLQPSARGEVEVQDAINLCLQDGFSAKGLLQPTPREWGPDLL